MKRIHCENSRCGAQEETERNAQTYYDKPFEYYNNKDDAEAVKKREIVVY